MIVPESKCLNCNKIMDRVSGITHAGVDEELQVSPGDVTICIKCGHLMAFDRELKLRELTGVEIKQVAGDPRILAVQRARKKLQQ